MKTAIAIAVGLALATLTGCAGVSRSDATYRVVSKYSVPVIPPQGMVYTHLKAPLSLDTTSFGARRGAATSHQIGLPPLPFPGLWSGLDLIAWGDASEESAAKDGGITHVEHADYDLLVVLYIYRQFTTEVYGD